MKDKAEEVVYLDRELKDDKWVWNWEYNKHKSQEYRDKMDCIMAASLHLNGLGIDSGVAFRQRVPVISKEGK